MSIAAIEQLRTDSLYVATGGGMGPGTLAALQAVTADLAARFGCGERGRRQSPGPGDRYAERHAEIAQAAGVPFRRLRPPEGLDWNDVRKQGRGS